jgi:hypothetical protein
MVVTLAACGGEDELSSAAEAESYVESFDGPCALKNVRCEPQHDAWLCRYKGGFLTLPRDGHPEVAVIC